MWAEKAESRAPDCALYKIGKEMEYVRGFTPQYPSGGLAGQEILNLPHYL